MEFHQQFPKLAFDSFLALTIAGISGGIGSWFMLGHFSL